MLKLDTNGSGTIEVLKGCPSCDHEGTENIRHIPPDWYIDPNMCEDRYSFKIVFCPFCGERLRGFEDEEKKMKHMGIDPDQIWPEADGPLDDEVDRHSFAYNEAIIKAYKDKVESLVKDINKLARESGDTEPWPVEKICRICRDCKFFYRGKERYYSLMNGQCRRYAPAPRRKSAFEWPVSKESYWCGEWEVRE